MSIKGQLQSVEVNNYGYPRIRVSGVWYGGDKKQKLSVSEGDIVEFEAFKNDRGYETFKVPSIKKIAGDAIPTTSVGQGNSPVDNGGRSKASGTSFASQQGSRDTYWADKATEDKAKEPKIAYFAANERAIQFVALAHTMGALGALAKAKETAKLEILTALVNEQTQRILEASYAQKAPSVVAQEDAKQVSEPADEAATEGDVKWK